MREVDPVLGPARPPSRPGLPSREGHEARVGEDVEHVLDRSVVVALATQVFEPELAARIGPTLPELDQAEEHALGYRQPLGRERRERRVCRVGDGGREAASAVAPDALVGCEGDPVQAHRPPQADERLLEERQRTRLAAGVGDEALEQIRLDRDVARRRRPLDRLGESVARERRHVDLAAFDERPERALHQLPVEVGADGENDRDASRS